MTFFHDINVQYTMVVEKSAITYCKLSYGFPSKVVKKYEMYNYTD